MFIDDRLGHQYDCTSYWVPEPVIQLLAEYI